MGRNKKATNRLSNPFSSLKGFSVSTTQPPLQSSSTAPVKATGPEIDFVAEMRELGVSPIPRHETVVYPPLRQIPDQRTTPGDPEYATEEELFIHSLGRMDSLFNDNWSEIDEPPQPCAKTRRITLIRQGRLNPEATLDLHGFTREEARSLIGHFLRNASSRGYRIVLIVTGWGKGSGGNAVLRDDLLRGLRSDWSGWVAEWTLAPRKLGGDGAVVVVLKRNPVCMPDHK